MPSPEHEAVLKRFDEVASREYPFALPEKVKFKGKHVELTSFNNLLPLLTSGPMLLFTILRPPLFFLSAVTAYFSSGMVRPLAGMSTVFILCGLARDVFFMHWITDGRSGLAGGAKDGIACKDTKRNNRIAERLRRFVNYKPTPFLWSGDLLTLAPFVIFKGSVGGRVNYQRWWVRVPAAKAPDGPAGPSKKLGAQDDEAVGLDVSFPADGHRADRPTFLVLHGLNGGSTEPYVLDLVRRANKEGHTVAVMIARGLMKTPIRGMESFNGSRTSDVANAVDVLLYGLGGERRCGDRPKKTSLVLVGFSMGAIIAANYTAKSKEESGLAGAVCFSGCLSSQQMLLPVKAAQHSLTLWQPILAWGLKGTVVKPNQAKLLKRGITADEVETIRTVVDIDTQLVCKYHGFKEVRDYYEDMSAGGRGDADGLARLAGAKVPLVVVHAIDDPISIYEVTLAKHVPKTDNVLLLSTKHGGHIGWPLGWTPAKKRWSFMVDIAMEVSSVLSEEKLEG